MITLFQAISVINESYKLYPRQEKIQNQGSD